MQARNWVMLGSWPLPVSTFLRLFFRGWQETTVLEMRYRLSSIVEVNNLPSAATIAAIVLIGIQRSRIECVYY